MIHPIKPFIIAIFSKSVIQYEAVTKK